MSPVRRITNTNCKKNTGFFPSTKMGKPIAFESLLERDYIYLLEFDKDVISYAEQPLTIKYCFNDKKARYVPDFLVNRVNSTQLVEVKPQNKMEKLIRDERSAKKFIAAYDYCFKNNYEYRIVTDEMIRTGNMLNNIKKLFQYSRVNVPGAVKLRIRNHLLVREKMAIDDLIRELDITEEDRDMFFQYVFFLLYSQFLVMDLSEKLSKRSIVRINNC